MAAATGFTSSTVSGRPSSRTIVVNSASSSPQAVIHSVNGAGSRSTLSAYPWVVTQRDTRTPIDAIFLGARRPEGGIHTPVSPSIVVASSSKAIRVSTIARSRSRTYPFTSFPCRVRSRIG